MDSGRSYDLPTLAPVLHLDIGSRVFLDWLLDNSRADDGLRGLWGTGARTASALTLQRTRQLDVVAPAAEFLVNATEPVTILLLAKPVAVTDADHNAAQLSFPSLSIRAVDRERFTVNIRHTCDRDVAAVGWE